MGVHALEYFMEHEPISCYEKVDIAKLAQTFRSNNNGKTPVIVIDGSNVLRSVKNLCGPDDDFWILGGQMKEFVANVQGFVSSFKKIGVEVVFFFKGATTEDKRQHWIETHNEKINVRIIPALNTISKMNKSDTLKFTLPPLIGGTARFATQFESHCKTHFSLGDDDYEIAEYARENDCFAILTQDSDFVIHEGKWLYLSAKYLNLETMTTIQYDKVKLKKRLGLDTNFEMHLFATLMGNDFIHHEKLKPYHKRITSKFWIVDERVPGIVRDIKMKYKKGNLEYVSWNVFGNRSMTEEIQKSISSYCRDPSVQSTTNKTNSAWDIILQKAKEQHKKGTIYTYTYPVMAGEAYELSIALEPYGTRNFVSTAETYLPLRRRIYAVLLHGKPGCTHVTEWCISSHGCPKVPQETPIANIPNIGAIHPGQLALMAVEKPSEIKWKLLVEGLTEGRKLDAKELKKLGFPYAVPVCILYYLHEEHTELLGLADIDAILALVAVLENYSAEDLKEIPVDLCSPEVKEVILEFIRVSTLYHRGITTFLFLLSACGFPLKEAMPWHYYDGKLLLQKYIQAVRRGLKPKELCENNDSAYKLFNKMKSLVISEAQG